MNQRSDEQAESVKNQPIPQASQPKVSKVDIGANQSHIVSEVRCPHILKNKKTGEEFRCNYKAMELEFGKGTTKCRNCRKIFSFEVNTTHIRFFDESIVKEPVDVLE